MPNLARRNFAEMQVGRQAGGGIEGGMITAVAVVAYAFTEEPGDAIAGSG